MELAVAGDSHKGELQKWASGHDISLGSVIGDSPNLEGEFNRIRKKVKDKAKQLAHEHFNVIAISMHSLFMMAGDKAQMLVDLVQYLEQFLIYMV